MNEDNPTILIANALGVGPCIYGMLGGQMRKLPDDPFKRRTQQLKRIYQHLQHFQALLETGAMTMPGIVTIPDTAEEIYLADLMVGIHSLPPQQRRAFTLICLQGWTETDATKEILPESKWSTPVQQYADTALARMIAAYDQYQLDGSIPAPYQDRRKRTQKILQIVE